MKQFIERKSFRLDGDTSELLAEVARHCFRTESTLIRKYVRDGVLKDAERYATETKRVLDATITLKRV